MQKIILKKIKKIRFIKQRFAEKKNKKRQLTIIYKTTFKKATKEVLKKTKVNDDCKKKEKQKKT